MKTTLSRLWFALIVSAIMLFAFASCARVDTPVNSQTPALENLPLKAAHDQGILLVNLPGANSLRKAVSSSGVITVQKGGSVSVESSSRGMSISMTLSFSSNSVESDLVVTAAVDESPPSCVFTPSGMVFLKAGRLDVNAEGVDLSYLPPEANGVNRVNLLWYNPQTNSWEVMSAGKISVDLAKGKLVCTNGKIPHFSRYSFGFIIGP